MKLEFAFLTDAATLLPNGLFDVVGGGFDVVEAFEFPATKYAMALIGRVRCEPRECGKHFKILAEILDPNGQIIPPSMQVEFDQLPHPRDPNPQDPKLPNITTFAFNYQGLRFPTPGKNTFRLSIGAEELMGITRLDVIGEVILEVVHQGDPK